MRVATIRLAYAMFDAGNEDRSVAFRRNPERNRPIDQSPPPSADFSERLRSEARAARSGTSSGLSDRVEPVQRNQVAPP
jgi:hypothetical protein